MRYTFKHALVQDAAYDSLLKSKRAQWHSKVAQVLEGEFSDAVAHEPELLAHHFTEVGLNDRAVPYWTRTGQRALERVAFAEAISQLETALTVNDRLPSSVERDRKELQIRLLLASAYFGSLGWADIDMAFSLANNLHWRPFPITLAFAKANLRNATVIRSELKALS